MEFALRFVRIPAMNFASRGFCDCNYRRRIFYATCLRSARNRESTLTAAKANKPDGARQPFIAEVDHDRQKGELFPELLDQENGREGWRRDEDQVDISLPNNAAGSARQHR